MSFASTLRYHQSPATLHVGCEKPRAYFVPYQDEATARTDNRAKSNRFLSLCGDWDFHYYPSIPIVRSLSRFRLSFFSTSVTISGGFTTKCLRIFDLLPF